LLLSRLNALRPVAVVAAAVPLGREAPPSGLPPATWLAEPVLVPVRFHGALDEAALRGALDALAGDLGGRPAAPHALDLRERSREERYGEALRAAGAETAEGAPARAVLARLDDAEHLLVLVLRPAGAPSPSALVRQLQARYDDLARPAAGEPQGARAAQSPEDLLAEVASFSDEDVELLLGQLEAGADLHVARAASVPVDPASAEALLAEIDQLADDDVDALLRQLSDA
jgi:hypothetical protein